MTALVMSAAMMFAAQADSGEDVVYVHEWGVVHLDEVMPTLQGARWGYMNEQGFLEPYYSMIVDAPVVWFHGPECTGTFTVEVQNGYFTTLLPPPDSIARYENDHPDGNDLPPRENYLAVWRDLRLTEPLSVDDRIASYNDEIMLEEGFLWATPFWCEVPALTVDHGSGSYVDRFIYYECSATGFMRSDGDHGESHLDHQGKWLEFQAAEGELICSPGNIVMGGLPPVLSDLEILVTLAGWGGNEFLPEEIVALWKTWRPVLRTMCVRDRQSVILFPMSEEQVESICTIEFRNDQGYPVEYSRLFLGLKTI